MITENKITSRGLGENISASQRSKQDPCIYELPKSKEIPEHAESTMFLKSCIKIPAFGLSQFLLGQIKKKPL